MDNLAVTRHLMQRDTLRLAVAFSQLTKRRSIPKYLFDTFGP
ncbi:hypothetical protein OE699_14695 [Sedimentimonas flavescens]|uniref:Uncharacterized protein n=1 Tax=Sedimentimonas flavescens TaxID=2851012 RepID=A0ABT3A2M9_9RHOB|nr:hypothetical protein [Sedimentimonas flavescens]